VIKLADYSADSISQDQKPEFMRIIVLAGELAKSLNKKKPKKQKLTNEQKEVRGAVALLGALRDFVKNYAVTLSAQEDMQGEIVFYAQYAASTLSKHLFPELNPDEKPIVERLLKDDSETTQDLTSNDKIPPESVREILNLEAQAKKHVSAR